MDTTAVIAPTVRSVVSLSTIALISRTPLRRQVYRPSSRNSSSLLLVTLALPPSLQPFLLAPDLKLLARSVIGFLQLLVILAYVPWCLHWLHTAHNDIASAKQRRRHSSRLRLHAQMDVDNASSVVSTATTTIIVVVVVVIVLHCVGGIAFCCWLKKRRERRAARLPVIALPIPGQQDTNYAEGGFSTADSMQMTAFHTQPTLLLACTSAPELQTMLPVDTPSVPALAQPPSHTVNRTQEPETATSAGTADVPFSRDPFAPASVEPMDADSLPALQPSGDARLDAHSWNQDPEVGVRTSHPPGASALQGDTAHMDGSVEDGEPPPYTQRAPRRAVPRVREVYRYTEVGASDSESV